MNDKTLFTSALVVSILGIVTLFILSYTLPYQLTAIQDISSEAIGKKVFIEGEIISSRTFSAGQNFKIMDETGAISVVIYNEEKFLYEGQTIQVLGTIEEYRAELQIVAERITSVT